jgi:hypothetical protein
MGLTALFSGCGTHQTKEAINIDATKRGISITGMPRDILISCAGRPDWKVLVRNFEFLGYVGGNSMAMTLSQGYCETTFTLQNGIVSKAIYQERSGATLPDNEQCAYITQQCLGTTR